MYPKKPSRPRLFCCSACLVYSLSIPAAASAAKGEALSLSEEDFLDDVPVILSATRLTQSTREAPVATSVIDRETIHASGVRELADLFRLVPGFLVSHDNGYTPIVTYHGLSSEYTRRMQVLIDGRSVYSAAFGTVVWTDLPLAVDDIERIEVIRGPNSATYGANAFFATVNIITRHSADTSGVFLRSNVGNDDIRDGYLRLGKYAQNAGFRLTLGYNQDDGFAERADTRHVRLANFRGDYQPSGKDSLMLQFGYDGGNRELDSHDLRTSTKGDVNNRFVQLQWRHDISAREQFSLQFSRRAENLDQGYDVVIPYLGHVIVDNSVFAERNEVEAQHTRPVGRYARLVWGGGIRRDSIEAPGYLGTSPLTGYSGDNPVLNNDQYRLFANLEWHLTHKLLFNAGAMWEKTDIAGSALSPRLGLNYLIDSANSLRLTLSQARRTPTINEARSNFRVAVFDSNWIEIPSGVPKPTDFISTQWIGNPDLKSETITSYELGYMLNLPQRGLNLDIKLFLERLDNLINVDENKVFLQNDYYDQQYEVFENAGSATTRGIETAIDYRPWRLTRLRVSHSLLHLHSDFPNLPPDSGDETAPKQIFSAFLMQRFPAGISGSLMYYLVSDSNGFGSGEPVQGHKQLDLRLAAAFGGRHAHGELALVVQNLRDANYVDWRSDNIAERRQYVTLEVQFD